LIRLEDKDKPGRLVTFSTTLQPGAVMELMKPAERTDVVREPVSRGTRGGLMFMRIMAMSDADKRQLVGDAAIEDASVVWWAMLTAQERREFMRSAEHDLKERFG
jgi:hypothetical protein